MIQLSEVFGCLYGEGYDPQAELARCRPLFTAADLPEDRRWRLVEYLIVTEAAWRFKNGLSLTEPGRVIARLEAGIEILERELREARAVLQPKIFEAQDREREASDRAWRLQREVAQLRSDLARMLHMTTGSAPPPASKTPSAPNRRPAGPPLSPAARAIMQRPMPDPIGLAEERRIAEEDR